MGKNNSKLIEDLGGPPKADVGFDSFEVLRAIGKGAFGKVRTKNLKFGGLYFFEYTVL